MTQNYKRKGHRLAPWWLYLILVPLLSFVTLIIAIIIRVIVGLPNVTPRESGIELLAWLGYTVSWMIFAAMTHKEQGFYVCLPYSILVLCGAIVIVFLIT